MAKKKTLKNRLRDELQGYVAELLKDRITVERRKEIASSLVTVINKMRYVR